MSGTATLRGADRLQTTLAAAADALGDLSEPNRRAAELVVSRSRSRVPVRTGRLLGSLRGVGDQAGGTMGSSLVYAGPIHNGWPAHHIRANPFLGDTLRANVDTVAGVYADAVVDAIGQVKGL